MICYQCEKRESRPGRKSCEICATWQKEYRRANRDKLLTNMVIYRQKHGDKWRAVAKANRTANPEKERAYRSDYRQKLKLIVFAAYSRNGEVKCALCDECRIGALTMDHINGGGSTHRKSISKIYFWLRKNGYPPEYQILCSNCNFKKYLVSIRSETAVSKTNRLVKDKLMSALGGSCEICHKTDLDILTVHHTNNDGASHRAAISGGCTGIRFYRAVLRLKEYSGLTCRCFSCNDHEEWSVAR